MGVITIN